MPDLDTAGRYYGVHGSGSDHAVSPTTDRIFSETAGTRTLAKLSLGLDMIGLGSI
jgi:hypothetical protein